MRLRDLLSIVGLAAGTLFYARAAEAQRRAVRFEIVAVGDSTLQFKVGTAGWVRRGQTGMAVDPRKHDELVARFKIMRVSDGAAMALVTGQTTALSTEHVATLEEPKRPWFRAKTFWSGLVLGAVMGITGAAVSR